MFSDHRSNDDDICRNIQNLKRHCFLQCGCTFYRKSHLRNFFLNQPFVDKTISLQTSSVIPVRDRTVSQQALRDVLLKDRVVYSFGFPTFRRQPMSKQKFFVTTFRDKPLFKDVLLKNREIRGERAILRDNPFEGQSLTPEKIFEGQASTYKSTI